jgi:hypothetical protein
MTNLTEGLISTEIERIKANRVVTLSAFHGRIRLKHIADVANALYYNESIENLEFVASANIEPDQWLPLLTAFQRASMRRKVRRILLSDSTIPYNIAITFLWQFRNIHKNFFRARQNLDSDHWESLRAAFWRHPTLTKLILVRPTTAEKSGHDILVRTIATTVPTLTHFEQNGYLSLCTIVSLVKSSSLRTLICSHGFSNVNMKEAIQLHDAFSHTNLVALSLTCTRFSECAVSAITSGIQVRCYICYSACVNRL